MRDRLGAPRLEALLLRLRHRARRWRTSVATPLMRAPEVGQ
jgi:hypothetical protein